MLRAPDVLIAGAGPAGAATAIRLARHGLSVVLADRAVFPREKICSEYNGPEAVRHLATLGVLTPLEAAGGHRIRGTRVEAPGGASLTGLFARAGQPPFRDTGLSISRRLLDACLVDAARRAGAVVLERTQVRAVIREGSAVRGLVLNDGTTDRELRARLTVGADGLHSSVAHAIGERRPARLRRFGFAGHFGNVAGLGDTAELHVTPRGYVGINPVGGGIANVALVVPAALAARARGRVPAFFHEELERFPRVTGRVRPAEMVRAIMATGPFNAWSRRVTAPGALLVGDAADFFDPFTGEGICAALRGADLVEAAMLDSLTGNPATLGTALGRYEWERRRAFSGKWIIERAIGYAMLAPAFFDRAVERLERRGLAHTLIGVTGDFVPARAVLNPVFLSQVVF